jgi:hypothetical protein
MQRGERVVKGFRLPGEVIIGTLVTKATSSVGWAFTDSGNGTQADRTVLWRAGQTAAQALPGLPLPAGQYSDDIALAINDAGVMVGQSTPYWAAGQPLDPHAVIWTAGGGTIIDLNTVIEPVAGLSLLSALGGLTTVA